MKNVDCHETRTGFHRFTEIGAIFPERKKENFKELNPIRFLRSMVPGPLELCTFGAHLFGDRSSFIVYTRLETLKRS